MDTVNLFKSAYSGKEDQSPLPLGDTSTVSDSSRSYDISKMQWLREYIAEQEALISKKTDWCIDQAVYSMTRENDRTIVNALCEAGALRKALNELINNKDRN